MENQLFNQTLLKKYSKNFKLNPRKYDLLKEYNNKVESGNFKSETKNYLYFYDVILKGILGYRGEDVLFDEKGDVGTGRSEFVLKSDDKKFMVIELKGQGIDLDKRQSGRSDNKSPVEQAFGYAINTGDVDWIMVSNYDEFRLYNYYGKTKYISFNAGELLDKQKFAYFMLAFSRKSHIEFDYITKVKEDTLVVDRQLASEFYKLYNETRLMLIKELETESQMERLDAIHYAQLILNRYMFICFAEDTNLLPPQISIDTIATPIQKGNIRHRSIWQRFNELCLDINEGNEFKKISEYNGGLFSEDLDFIKIRDIVDDQSIFKDAYQKWNFTEYEKDITHLLGKAKDKINPIYRNMLTISAFDFSTELDVNILGHIFENSIGDIEELKEDSKGRRKKEGIFYTPDYITDYICRNTIIPYLSKSGDSNTVEELMGEYWGSKIEDLDRKVQNIKIVDPACGSGAFLNKAADVLLEIHQAIHQTRYKDKKDTLTPYFDSVGERREILLNNIYGVDLNEESTEITKLSLFLKVCRKDLKLPNLDNNIKWGNSLIESPEYTDRPFNWGKEFSNIVAKGGFDVVIGNPPYVDVKTMDNNQVKYIFGKYITATKRINLYSLFVERSLDILNQKGYFGFIIPNSILYNESYTTIREKLLKEVNLTNIVRLPNEVFDSAKVETILLTFQKTDEINKDVKIIIYDENATITTNEPKKIISHEIAQSYWDDGENHIFRIFSDETALSILNKIETNSKSLIDLCEFSLGLTPYDKHKGHTKEQIEKKVFHANFKKDDTFKKLLSGADVQRYSLVWNGEKWISYGEWLSRPREPRFFINPRILIRQIISGNPPRIYAAYSDKEFYNTHIAFNILSKNESKIDIKFILSLINSKLMTYYHKEKFLDKSKTLFQKILIANAKKLPIKLLPAQKQQLLIEKTDKMLKINENLQYEVNGFKKWIKMEFGVEKLSQKMERYYELSEDEFIDEMRKKKVDTKLRKNREYLEKEFNESLAIINPILKAIDKTDNEIDQIVYKLYGLEDSEIKIIENELKI